MRKALLPSLALMAACASAPNNPSQNSSHVDMSPLNREQGFALLDQPEINGNVVKVRQVLLRMMGVGHEGIQRDRSVVACTDQPTTTVPCDDPADSDCPNPKDVDAASNQAQDVIDPKLRRVSKAYKGPRVYVGRTPMRGEAPESQKPRNPFKYEQYYEVVGRGGSRPKIVLCLRGKDPRIHNQ